MHEKRLIVLCEEDNTMRQMILTEINTTTISQGLKNMTQSSIETPIMPFGTVLLKMDGTSSVYFIQKPPEKVVIRFKGKKENDKGTPTHYTIAYPWRVFALMFKGSVISDYNLRFASGPIRSMTDQLYRPPLPNMEEDAGLCMGVGLAGFAGTTGPMSEIADRVLAWVDKTNYNNDLATAVCLVPKEMNPPENISRCTDARVTFALWEKWTKEAGRKWRDITSLSWHSFETFGEFIGRIG